MLNKRNINLITSIISVFLISSPTFATPAHYAQQSEESFWENIWRRITRRPREDERTGSSGKGGANRDHCPYTTEELVAIVPVSSESRIPYVERTALGYPSWWFYVPYTSEGRRQAEFVLLNADEQIVYERTWFFSNTPGVIQVSLPETESPLSPNSSYRWVFSIICSSANRSGDATVNGWIHRISLAEAAEFEVGVASDQERYIAYARDLYWFDLLTEVNQRRLGEPELFEPLWDTLLCQVYLQSERSDEFSESCSMGSWSESL